MTDREAWVQRTALMLARLVSELVPEEEPQPVADHPAVEITWRERLWTCPGETRLGVVELAEALGRSDSWIYKHTASASDDPIPHRKVDGQLVFVAQEIRAWWRDREEIMAGPGLRTVA